MKKSTLYFMYALVSVCIISQGTLSAQEDDGIYSVSGQKKEKKKKQKDTDKSESLYFLEDENAENSDAAVDSKSDGYKQSTTTETGDDYAQESKYDNYTMSEAYTRQRLTNPGVVPTVPGFGMRTSLGTRSMYGYSGMYYGGLNPMYAYNGSFYNDPFYNPYMMTNPGFNMSYGISYGNFNSMWYSPYSFYNPWGASYYNPWGYGFGGSYYLTGNNFYNPYGMYNPYYMHCPPYQSGFYGDNNLYTGPRPAVSGGSITTGGGDNVTRPGGVRISDSEEIGINNYQPKAGSISDIPPTNGLTRVRDYERNSLTDRNSNLPDVKPPTDVRDNINLPKTDDSSRKSGNSFFRISGGNDSPANRDSNFNNNREQRSPFGNSGTRSNDRPSYNSPSRSGNTPSYNSPSRSPSSPSQMGGGSRSTGGSIRR